MSAIMAWLARAFAFGGPAAIGYFINDIASLFARVIPPSVPTTDSNGRPKPWLVVVAALAGGLVLFMVMKLLKGKRKTLYNFLLIGLSAYSAYLFGASFFGEVPGYALAVALGTLTTGAAVVTTFNTTYLPEFFYYVAATQLTGVRVTVQGEGVIFDLDANGLNALRGLQQKGTITNGNYFPLANGNIYGKNIIWEFTNSAAQTPVVYIHSDETPEKENRMYAQAIRAAVLAGSGIDFEKFFALGLPSLAATDVINVLFNDGTQQQFNRIDLQARLLYTQNEVNAAFSYTIDNFNRAIKKVNLVATAAQTAYLYRWVPSESRSMINQTPNA